MELYVEKVLELPSDTNMEDIHAKTNCNPRLLEYFISIWTNNGAIFYMDVMECIIEAKEHMLDLPHEVKGLF